MELLIRDAKPDDAAGIVSFFNPIIEARSFTLFDTPVSIESERSYIACLASLGAGYRQNRQPVRKKNVMETFGSPVKTWQAAKDEIRSVLIQCARFQKTIAYSELVQKIKTLDLQAHDPPAEINEH